jgi:hypothetical protein
MRSNKSYYQPPVFVSVEAGNYAAAVGAAVREAKKRMAVTLKGMHIAQVKVIVMRVRDSQEKS